MYVIGTPWRLSDILRSFRGYRGCFCTQEISASECRPSRLVPLGAGKGFGSVAEKHTMLEENRGPDGLVYISNWIRRLVSQNRRRYLEDGFDLDLCYVTDRIIAMGLPAEGGQGLLRNPLQEIVRLLQMKHRGYYKVYNLCKEHGYDPKKMGAEVAYYPFEDHQTPPLKLIKEFCQDAEEWLSRNPTNVIAVHCKAGKGRTGIMICSLMIYLGICSSAEEAIEYFAQRRTINNRGVTIPSQLRYIGYFDRVFHDGLQIPQPREVSLEHVRISGLPKNMLSKIVMKLYTRSPPGSDIREITLVKALGLGQKACSCMTPKGEPISDDCVEAFYTGDVLQFNFEQDPGMVNNWVVQGDVKVQIFLGSPSQSMFYVWVNTSFLHPSLVATMGKQQLDKVRKWVPDTVNLEIKFTTPDDEFHAVPLDARRPKLATPFHYPHSGAKRASSLGSSPLSFRSANTDDSGSDRSGLLTRASLFRAKKSTSMPPSFDFPNLAREGGRYSYASSSWANVSDMFERKWCASEWGGHGFRP